mmetsp:Transcript_76007/g.191287  ORF Transcript_76007/g.191287 Transcript_76007/m.191287 type:complete len:200 (-) Transcript_76007:3213-3812(-)
MGEGHRDTKLLQCQPAILRTLHEEVVIAFTARRELSDNHWLLMMLTKGLEHARHIIGCDDERHTDPTIESRDHLMAWDAKLPCNPSEHGWELPLLSLQVGLQLLWQDPRDALLEATAGDRGSTLELACACQGNDGLGVDPRRREENFSQSPRGVEGCSCPVLHSRRLGRRAQQAEAVAVQPRRRQADDHVTAAHPVPVR